MRLFFSAIGVALTVAGCTYDYEGARRCSNGLKDGDETEVDCGGSCQTCPNLTRMWMKLGVDQEPPKRGAEALVYEPGAGRVLLFSGHRVGEGKVPAVPTDDTWTLDGAVWTQHHPVNSPTPRHYAMAGYDEVGQRTLVAGGSGNDVNDTWAWDGSDWSRLGNLPARNAGGMVWAGNVLLLLAADPDSVMEVLAFNGTSWDELSTTGAPVLNGDWSAFAYDSLRKRTVVFLRNGQTWEYAAGAWTQNELAGGPGQRCGAAMAYDEERKVTVLFGGALTECGGNPEPLFDDTWEYDGRTWQQVTTSGTPRDRVHSKMVYDQSRQQMVLFGGEDTGFHPIEDFTWIYYVLGTRCSIQADCAHGYCHDDVCCETESCPPDQACNSKAQSGTCTVRE